MNIKHLIESLTKDVLQNFNIQIPILNIDETVNRLGGTIHNSSDDGIMKCGSSFKILVAYHQDKRTRKFFIARQLGHLFLHMGYGTAPGLWEKQQDNVPYKSNDVEREWHANWFAFSFLMPKEEYSQVMNEHTLGDNKVNTSKIAKYFDVSIATASNRGQLLGYLKRL